MLINALTTFSVECVTSMHGMWERVALTECVSTAGTRPSCSLLSVASTQTGLRVQMRCESSCRRSSKWALLGRHLQGDEAARGKTVSRAHDFDDRFRSCDLWVMGPPRSSDDGTGCRSIHCATSNGKTLCAMDKRG